jgi:hypothetical protein
MIRSRGLQFLAALTILVIGAPFAIYGAVTVLAEPPGPAPASRQAGAWTGPDRDQLLKLRDEVVRGDHRFDYSTESIVPQVSEYAKAILSDGNLTFDEYRQAASDWAACVASVGVTVPDLRLDGLGRYHNQTLAFHGETAAQAGMAAVKACSAKYTDAVDFVWAGVTVQLSKEVVRASRAAIGACFAATGNKDTTRPWDSEVDGVRVAFFSCASEVQSELDIIISFGMDGDGLPVRQ